MARGRRPPQKLAAERLGGFPIRRDRMAAVAHICRAASAVRRHLANSVRRGPELTWTAFVVRVGDPC
ncbi:hypothetical protein [Streptomyces canus]|uniref:hypothetical protein n=1 Tax=Streptomyces canus TaxID=58343 RepID=UPI00386D27CB